MLPADVKKGWDDGHESSVTVDGKDWSVPSPPLTIVAGSAVDRLFLNGTAYDSAFLAQAGVCQTTRRYVWGFSVLLLFIVSIFTLVFSLIMTALWAWAEATSTLARSERTLGATRAAVDLAAFVRDEMRSAGGGGGGAGAGDVDVDSLSDKQLLQKLDRSSNGVKYSCSYAADGAGVGIRAVRAELPTSNRRRRKRASRDSGKEGLLP